MSNIFDKWNESIDVEALAKDVEEIEKNSTGDYEEVPHGTYEVAVKNMELKNSKSGNKMVTIWFKVVSDNHKGGMIFLNQVVTNPYGIHTVNGLLRKMVSMHKDAPEIKFKDFNQYNDLILDVFEITDGYEYGLKYTKGKNDFSNYEITEVFPVE